jgi:CHASE2 domain-containing sensor protein
MTSEQIWGLIMGVLFCGYGGFVLSHLVCSYRRPLRGGKTGRGRPLSRVAIGLTGSSWFSFGLLALASIFIPAITPAAIPFAVIAVGVAYLASGIWDDLRR